MFWIGKEPDSLSSRVQCAVRPKERWFRVDFTKLRKLHEEGRWEAASKLFEQMLREEVYDEHHIGEEVSHLVHYTTLDALISMLGVSALDGEAYVLADTKRQAAQRTGAAKGEDAEEEEDGARRRGYLRLYDTFSANDPNEGTFFVSSADPNGLTLAGESTAESCSM